MHFLVLWAQPFTLPVHAGVSPHSQEHRTFCTDREGRTREGWDIPRESEDKRQRDVDFPLCPSGRSQGGCPLLH